MPTSATSEDDMVFMKVFKPKWIDRTIYSSAVARGQAVQLRIEDCIVCDSEADFENHPTTPQHYPEAVDNTCTSPFSNHETTASRIRSQIDNDVDGWFDQDL